MKGLPWREVTTHNVVAVLPGSDPSVKGEYVVVGAHLDHIGDWPRLNPGADDNASGSATLLEVARAAATLKIRPRRSVVFVWFAAEELGLRGAEHFASHPPKGFEKCVAVLNLDMLGAGNGLYVAGGENFPEIRAAMEAARDRLAPGFGLKSGKIRGEGRADHAPFFEKGIHAVSLFGSGGRAPRLPLSRRHRLLHHAEDDGVGRTDRPRGGRRARGRESPSPDVVPRSRLERQRPRRLPGPLSFGRRGAGYFPGTPSQPRLK